MAQCLYFGCREPDENPGDGTKDDNDEECDSEDSQGVVAITRCGRQ